MLFNYAIICMLKGDSKQMPTITKTRLNKDQITRLINTLDINQPIRNAYLCQVTGTQIKKIAINYTNGKKEVFYPMDDELDIILNGIVLTRNKD